MAVAVVGVGWEAMAMAKVDESDKSDFRSVLKIMSYRVKYAEELSRMSLTTPSKEL